MNKDCSTCIYKEGSCYPSKTIFDKDKTCKSYDPDYEEYIAELEKENAELRAIAENQQSSNMERYFKNKDLEKENAELKADFLKACRVKEQGFREAEQALERKDEQLTKAKEIIKKIEKIFYSGENAIKRLSEISDILAEAEQFLKDSE